MVHANQRCGFSQAIALNYGNSETLPEFFGHAIQRCTTADKGPEFPSKSPPNLAEDPGAMEEVLGFGDSNRWRKWERFPQSCKSRSTFSFSDCNTRGTATKTETRSRLMVATISDG